MITSIFNDSLGFFSSTATILVAALLLDRLIGEPKSWHPLIWFGRWVDYCQHVLQQPLSADSFNQRVSGVLAWCAAVLPCLLVLLFLYWLLPDGLDVLLSVIVLYFSIGWQSLREHALAIATPLSLGRLEDARFAVSRIVSRDTDNLTESDVAKAGIESVLENGSDAIFAPIFWFIILGAPGALVYRLANTLDAMWGYKTRKLLYFGWFAARFDDVLNYLPARLVVYTYALCGDWSRALRSARKEEVRWKSPNAGPVMAAGAGALGVKLGGEAPYFGKIETRPDLGEGDAPTPQHLEKAIWLVDKSVYLWGLLICILI
ncbi:adenosylcobinamide-phosphate synthase CbiB [Marinomonas flavescens]|uniref:adenosylcobinamide-phosphate synthase CbiB n=1 Tax=Marinomonas flavescens TaxID=2529379 RepID=UPI0010563E0E|nr:adenosylcobinamide-phosphate synthase CbiB [Marinomonas flavescens]